MKDAKVRVWWQDALLYSTGTPHKMNLRPSPMITEGILLKDEKEGVVIKDPKTVHENNEPVHHTQPPTFLFVPRGMIVKIEKI